ncbi:hypothetical protein SH449x_004739 [Pirellulaceae bacterium SH449]
MIRKRFWLLSLVFLTSFLASAKCQDVGREAVERYLLSASDRRDNLAYRFEAQLGYSRPGEDPRVRVVKGVSAVSKDTSVEFYSSSSVPINSVFTETNPTIETFEYLRLGKKRFQKIYLTPSNAGESEWSSDAIVSSTSASWIQLGLDADGKPVAQMSVRFCPLGLPLSSAINVLQNRTDVDYVGDAFFRIFEFKEEREKEDKLIAEWYSVNRLGLVTVVLDPSKDYLPVLKSSRVFDGNGNISNTLEYTTKTKWTKVEEEYYPSEVVLTHRSKGSDYEWVFKFEYLLQSTWDNLASTIDWEKMTGEKGDGLTRSLYKEFDMQRKKNR